MSKEYSVLAQQFNKSKHTAKVTLKQKTEGNT
jgi:hypothetical protein